MWLKNALLLTINSPSDGEDVPAMEGDLNFVVWWYLRGSINASGDTYEWYW